MNKIDYGSYFLNKSVVIFFIKFAIFFIFSITLIDFSIGRLKAKDESIIVLYAKGLINNPEVFWSSSIYYENSGRLDKAVKDLFFAVGIFHANSASDKVVAPYIKRIKILCKKMEDVAIEECFSR